MAVFLGGCSRSGTSLLTKIIGQHSSIAAFGESKFVHSQLFRNFPNTIFNVSKTERQFYLSKFKKYFIKELYLNFQKIMIKGSPESDQELMFDLKYAKSCLVILNDTIYLNNLKDIERCFACFIDALFLFFANKNKKIYWAEKTPMNSVFADLLYQWFKYDYCFKLINITRDGRDVACSIISHHWGPDTIIEGMDWWADRITIIKDTLKKIPTERCLKIRYEDLITQREASLDIILQFLNIPGFFSIEKYPIYSHAMGRWKSDMTKKEKQYASDKHGKLLMQLGYEV